MARAQARAREHFGTEPPDNSGRWISDGNGRWVEYEHSTNDSDSGGPRIAVVGGGPGGLFATYILNQRFPSAQVTIFEASDRLGGKIRSDEFSDGTPFEAGVAELYEYLGPGGKDPLRLLIEEDLGLETIDIAGGGVILKDEVLRDLDDVEEVYGPETRKHIEAFHKKMVKLMPLEKYAHRWQPDNAHPWAKDVFRKFIEEELGDDEIARDYVETAVHSDLATESHTCNGLNGIKNVLMDNDEYMQLYHVVGGIERVVNKLAAKIRAEIKTSSRVTSISSNHLQGKEPALSVDSHGYKHGEAGSGHGGQFVEQEVVEQEGEGAVGSDQLSTSISEASEAWFDYDIAAAIKEASKGDEGSLDSIEVQGEPLTEEEKEQAKMYAKILQRSAQSSTTKHKQLFRGMVLPDESSIKSYFRVNKKITINSLSATSPNKNIAAVYHDVENAGGGVPVMIHLENPNGVIGHQREDGGEVIIPKGAEYKITRIWKEGNVHHVTLWSTSKIGKSKSVASLSIQGNTLRYEVCVLKIGERTLRERSHDFDAVVIALPNHWLRTIQWDSKLAEAIHEVCAHYDLPAHYLRVSILFDKKWWADMRMPGEFWMMDMFNGCCCYDESTRWGQEEIEESESEESESEEKDEESGEEIESNGHVLSFLLAGGDALLLCSSNQDDDCIVEHLMQSLPSFMRQAAEDHFVEAQVDRYVGSINAQPGGWPAEELRGEHIPEPDEHPGIFLVGDYFFDSTLNAALMSANVAIELLLEHFEQKSAKVTEAIKQLESRDTGI